MTLNVLHLVSNFLFLKNSYNFRNYRGSVFSSECDHFFLKSASCTEKVLMESLDRERGSLVYLLISESQMEWRGRNNSIVARGCYWGQ